MMLNKLKTLFTNNMESIGVGLAYIHGTDYTLFH